MPHIPVSPACPHPRCPPPGTGAACAPTFLAVHAVPDPRLDAGNRRSCARPGPVLAEPLEGPSRLAAEMGMSKEAPEVQEGFLEVATQAEALAPPPSPPGQCLSSEPLSPEWSASSKKRPLFLRRRFQELGLLAVATQDSFLEHRPRQPRFLGSHWAAGGGRGGGYPGRSLFRDLTLGGGPSCQLGGVATLGRGQLISVHEGTCLRAASGPAQRGHLSSWAQNFGQLAWVPPPPPPPVLA